MRAYYYTRDREYRKDDYLHISLSRMFKELPGDGIIGVYWMNFTGDVGTNKHAQGYDSALDLATFTLKPQQYPSTTGRELGELEGSFYGANGEAIAGTFWYIRGGERVEGAFGGER